MAPIGGEATPKDAYAVLETAVEQGVIFIDTADVYGDGRSEQFVGQFRKSQLDKKLFIATKMGRTEPQIFDEYTRDNFIVWNDRFTH